MADKTNYDLANRLTKLLEVEDSERFEERLNTALLESDYLLTEILDKLAIKLEVIQKVQSASSLFSTEAQLYRLETLEPRRHPRLSQRPRLSSDRPKCRCRHQL